MYPEIMHSFSIDFVKHSRSTILDILTADDIRVLLEVEDEVILYY